MAAAPEWQLDASESETLSNAIVAVSKHYDMQASAKAIDLGNLCVTFSIIYGGKFARTIARKRAEAAANPRSSRPVTVNAPATASAPQHRPATTVVHHPVAAGRPNGAGPVVRAKTEQDLAMLNEIEVYAPAM
jgi:hypothetical protein